ncbi:hypothetical protein [Butyrivibrio sp. NC2002]|uniref:hypothetical protein n=1 Tax=Butyrivibrio sp. NC2002 TaxID=1410610 RepID=UPI000B13A432|nr:hypothetical protein [Butyrivibrio sp. NC2002]
MGDKDEVIDHSITKSVVGNAKTYVVSGTHKLNRENYEELLIKEVTVFIRDMDNNQG